MGRGSWELTREESRRQIVALDKRIAEEQASAQKERDRVQRERDKVAEMRRLAAKFGKR